MVCEKCGSNNIAIKDSRYFPDRDYRRRRLICQNCGHKWTRYEISEHEFYRHKRIDKKITGEVNWWSKRKSKM